MEQNNSREIKAEWDALSAKAIPKNAAWRKLEVLHFEPDYSDADAGEEMRPIKSLEE